MTDTEPAEAEHDVFLEQLIAALRRDRLDPEDSSGDLLLDLLAAKVGRNWSNSAPVPNSATVTATTAALNDLGPVLRRQGFPSSTERDTAHD